MVMSGRSANLTTLFMSRLRPPKRLNSIIAHISPVADNCSSCISGRRNESKWSDRIKNPGTLALEPRIKEANTLISILTRSFQFS